MSRKTQDTITCGIAIFLGLVVVLGVYRICLSDHAGTPLRCLSPFCDGRGADLRLESDGEWHCRKCCYRTFWGI
jgi:hypothetical protein